MLYLIVSILCIFIILTTLSWFAFRQRNTPVESEHFNQCAKQGIPLDKTDVYLINLKRNGDRLEHFIEQYMKSDLRYKAFNRLDAIDGSAIIVDEYVTPKALQEIRDIEKNGYRTKHYQLTKGAIGCYLSHQKLYDMIVASDAEYGLIFEDDVMIDASIYKKLNKHIESIPNDWDILLLGCQCISCEKHLMYLNIKRFFLMHSYLIKKEAAIKLKSYLSSKKIAQQIDSELSDLSMDGQLKIYCLKTPICRQGGGFRTTIQKPIKQLPGVNPYSVQT